MDKREFTQVFLDAVTGDEEIPVIDLIHAFLRTEGPAASHLVKDEDGNPLLCVALAKGERAKELEEQTVGKTETGPND